MTRLDWFLDAFAKNNPETANALHRSGLGLEQLEQLPATSAEKPFRTADNQPWWSWEDLFGIRGMGPRRLLKLVNFARERGIELPWFEAWDKESATWTYLQGCKRVPPPGENTTEEQ